MYAAFARRAEKPLGPCNKVAYAFALACMETGNYAPPMAANFVACCAPPLAVALAMLIAPKKFTDEDRSESQDVSLEHYV